ncbi:pyridoxal phosphate-dependent transferase [Cladochytrium replicatum]|nr:pyridoxal phosphate-dependent transferase [Cladochytrium replicatum]
MYSKNSTAATNGTPRKIWDFRSDTVTVPTPAMREAMANAEVGDDVLDGDPLSIKLEERVAAMSGHEAGLFCASGTMTNQIGIRCHMLAPPHSIVIDGRAHVYVYEAGGIAYHTGASLIHATPKPGLHHLTADVVEKALILDDNVHHAPTKLVCLENTMDGEIFPFDELKKISEMVRGHGLAIHLDGARLWNASVETGVPLKDYCQLFDSVSLCLSKGLGAPIGSVLVGSKAFIKKARHVRKFFGGGWRQAGMLAAAAHYVLDHHLPTLKNDHVRAKRLAASLEQLGCRIAKRVDTNMVWVDISPTGIQTEMLMRSFEEHGVKNFGPSDGVMRVVIHHQVPDQAIDAFVKAVAGAVPK